ncbi:MAG: SusD/RagB family nutrient-binding outer membrane lipoprotein [Gemmatimonadetes bacterium]|nr:SusD/RagB family nutrient-binding outer membrane lipoprotein [Gemmatimonadota bacterium]
MKNRKWLGRALGAALLAGSAGACDFLEISGTDPNIISEPTLASLFVSAQLRSFAFSEGQLARVSAVWTQQLAGVDRQFSLLDRYVFGEDEADDEFSGLYTGGGLVDIRRGRAFSDSVGCSQCSALFQIHEAYLFGMGASIFGDLPYRGALVDGTPAALDAQQQVYADVQALLDNAIASLSTAPTGGSTAFYGQLSEVEFNFGGNRARWSAVANTLKARFYLHTAVVRGAPAYPAARAAAARPSASAGASTARTPGRCSSSPAGAGSGASGSSLSSRTASPRSRGTVAPPSGARR